jgi:D-alanine-D-alanine ligase
MPSSPTTAKMTPEPQSKLRVTLLAGGPSAEREISLDSGRAIADALRQRDHDVFVSDIGPDDLSALDRAADVVFPALHGTFGEDGTVQRIMEQRGIRFVGSGSRASALAMDKVATKRLASELGIPTAPYQVVTSTGEVTLPLPVVVKPTAEGSSVATSIARQPDELPPAVDAVVEKYGSALVERFVPGDELTIGILGTRALPPIFIRPKRAFYDLEAKYYDDQTEYSFESQHSDELSEQAAEMSLRLFRKLGCRHLARVDWIAEPPGALSLLEVNTLPGFTSHSLVPKAAARIGIAFGELVERLLRMAMEDDS